MTDAATLFAPLSEEERYAPPPPQDDGTADWEPVEPIPADAPEPPNAHPRLGQLSRRWAYRAADGGLSGYVCRFETVTPEGERDKEFRPLRWGRLKGRLGWHWKGWGEGRPLYRLPELLARPEATALVCEGEKAADAAADVLPDLVAITPMNGARSPAKTPTRDRTVVIATDNDEVGLAFGDRVAALCRAAGAKAVLWLPPDRLGAWLPGDGGLVPREGGVPKGYDLADAVEEGWTAELVQELRTDPAFFCPYLDAAERAEARKWAEEMDGVGRPAGDAAPKDKRRGYDWPFRIDPDGVRKRIERESKQTGETEVEWRWFCSRLEVLADTRDHRGEEWGRLLVVVDRDGYRHEWAMPCAMRAGSGEEYRRRLLSFGLVLAPGAFANNALHEYIATARPKERARCVDRCGWHGRVSITPARTFGDTGGEHILLQTAGAPPEFGVRGTLGGWQTEVAAYAVGNSRLAFALSTAFTGPLLYLTGEEGGGFHLSGPSSGGKTTALRCAASAWGCPVHTWRTSDNAAESWAAGANDGLLALDELSQVDGRAADAMAYMLGNGAGKGRARRDASGARAVATWRLVFLSTGEIGLAEKLGEIGRRARAGQAVRLVEVPAEAGAGHQLFEELHGFKDGDALARHLRLATEQHRGHAASAFLERVTGDLDGLGEMLAEARRRWLGEHSPKSADGQVMRVAGRFALVAAAGELAAAMGVLPWPDGEASRAVATCFRAWLERRGGVGSAELAAGLAQVRQFLEAHGLSRFEPMGKDAPVDQYGNPAEPRIINRAGSRRRDQHGRWEYLVMPETWRSEVCAGHDASTLAREMVRLVLVRPGNDGKPQRVCNLPGIGNKRVYHVTGELLGDTEPEGAEDA